MNRSGRVTTSLPERGNADVHFLCSKQLAFKISTRALFYGGRMDKLSFFIRIFDGIAKVVC